MSDHVDPASPYPGEEPILRADQLIAGYVPDVNILNGCDLTLYEDELVGIIGPNGAGKSTLIKSMFGLVPISDGTVTLRGKNITNSPGHELVSMGVSYVPQTRNVFAALTIEENLEMGLYLRPKLWAERYAFVCELFPLLKDRAKQRAGSLSGGERQMVAMGRALMMDPSVLFLDEPSAGLSPANQDDVFRRIAEINDAGISIVMVEQNAGPACRSAIAPTSSIKGRTPTPAPVRSCSTTPRSSSCTWGPSPRRCSRWPRLSASVAREPAGIRCFSPGPVRPPGTDAASQ